MIQSSRPFLTRAHEDTCCRDFSLHFPASELHPLTWEHEATSRAGTKRSIRLAPPQASLQHRDPGTTAGHPGGLLESSLPCPGGWHCPRKFSRACDDRNADRTGTESQSRPFCREPAEGGWERTADRRTHGQSSIVERSPAQLRHRRNCRDSPAHTVPPGDRSCPIPAPGKSLPTARV